MRNGWQDLTLAVRLLRKTPAFTLPAVVTLALGIGANGTIFTLADAVLLRPLPVADSERIVHIYQHRRGQAPQPFPLSFADYIEYRDGNRSFETLAAHYPTSPMHVVIDGEPVPVTGAVVTANYFDLLQLTASAGRFFSADEDRIKGRHPVAVIGHAFWQHRFGARPEAIGSPIRINGMLFTVVGVAPRGFAGVHPRGTESEVWIPSAMFGIGYRYCDAFARDCTIVRLLGKLRRGVSVQAAQRELDVLAARLENAYPATNKDRGVRIEPARGLGLGTLPEERRQLTLYMSVVGVVLVIACANVAGLLLARASGRRKEMAVRLALGATRGRVVSQLLTESVVIAAAGGGLGVLMAVWGGSLLEQVYAFDGAGRRLDFDLTMRAPIILTTSLVSLSTAMLFGLAPALQASRTDSALVLKWSTPDAKTGQARRWLVAGQVALSVILLTGAGLLLESARRLQRGTNFDPSGVVMVRLRPSLIDYSREEALAYQRAVLRVVEGIPGVASASPSVFLTAIGGGVRVSVSDSNRSSAGIDAVAGHGGARFFETLRVPVLDGREFRNSDDQRQPRVAIINDVLARRLWPSSRAVGQVVEVEGVAHWVVGVVADAQYYGNGESPRPQVFLSYWQLPGGDPFLNDARVMIRVHGDPATLLPVIRRAVGSVDPNVPLSEDTLLIDRVRFAYQPVRLARALVGSFASVAVLLTGLGLYGVLAFSVAQRTKEIGIRRAIGARRADIIRLVVGDGLWVALVGSVTGVVVAWICSRLLAALLYGVDPHDPVAFVGALFLVLAVAAGAAIIPARRAMNVMPSIALRGE